MKKNNYYLVLFILLTCKHFLYSQKSITKVPTFDPLLSIVTNNADSLLYLGKIMQNSSGLCESQKGVLLQSKGYYLNKNYSIAERLAKKILEETDCLVTNCSIINKINALNRLFNIKKNENDFYNAHRYLLKRVTLIEKLPKNNHYKLHLLSVKRDKAILESITGEYGKAINTLKKTNTIIDSMYCDIKSPIYKNYILQKISINNLLGKTYILSYDNSGDLSYLDSASISYKKAFDILKKNIPDNKNSKVYFDLRMIRIFIKKNKYKAAFQLLSSYNDSIEYLKTIHLEDVFYYYKFFIYNKINKKDSVFYYGKKYITSKNIKSVNTTAVYDTISEIYSKLDANDSAYYYSKKSAEIYKNIHKEISTLKDLMLQDELSNVNKKDKVLSEIKQRMKKYKILLFSVFILFTLIGFLFFFSKKNKKNEKSKRINIDVRLENRIINNLKQYEKTNFFLNKDTTLSSVAKELGTNTTYLSHLINKHKKKSFNQYLFDLRIDYLLRKLKEDRKFRKYTIKSMGEEIGYTNASAFTRAFKKYKKINPSDFLNELKID